MKKATYSVPSLTMMRFGLTDNIATSGCTSQSSSSSTYTQQLITCIIDGSEYVFYSSCSNNVTSGYLGTYNGQTYFVWYDGNVGGQPTSAQEQELAAIEAAVMGNDYYMAQETPGWHAGVASATISTIWSSSY